MNIDIILQNILNPPILFFFLGMLAVFLKSDLSIPQPLPKLFSLYLLIAIGLHGGYELSKSGLDLNVFKALLLAVFMATLIPIYSYFILKRKLDTYNAIAVAATYGSISAVTFITGITYLQTMGVEYGGYMVAAMTLMESPAIVIGLVFAALFTKDKNDVKAKKTDWKEILREAFLNPSVYLLVGALIIGILTGEKGWNSMEPLFGTLFKGFLAFFLLDMGLVAARKIYELKKVGYFLIVFALLMPVFNASVAVALAYFFELSKGDAFLLALLSGSASYIAVPAAMRLSVPQANPGIYLPLSLAITFPFNISLGIPLYYFFINSLWG
ncbi:sodium-dependent bicarbonate transport family permease [Poseidonibacter lekithochrous]|uniref:sodium-dependent bicarbonate transport family permease n=1 Tax=Poseidonibacter TaxID=2321187 RepID=UPI001C09816C|nr:MULTISPECIES: sodium-dependent bicarbonate transport family permease [Poseidonibacter]MBU3015989.1 sodium-dependent bicarbonate transport family permease [Poseidonibacter lekithochrous]MDO6829288.1 sodium-dependent bicarbonate transport family permease [Poseidonibacter sp. 1_MG-2023]